MSTANQPRRDTAPEAVPPALYGTAAGQPGGRGLLTLTAVCLGTATIVMEASVLNLAIPTINDALYTASG